ncbi:cytokinin dehydrogenase 3 [Vigna radiata var. radiata]|uniref:cytokinin dehydrogenase n=1 Tax=Vigna radiata var. radiata TaxID=3916 RepID=A0A1S3UNM3_VIGRR|nr:cytokinin dehydrogenase 3 [Vigna radiata var. radiata]
MALNYPSSTCFILLLVTITRLIYTVGKTEQRKALILPDLDIENIFHKLRDDPETIQMASTDYGHIVHELPAAVFHPSSIDDIATLIKTSYNSFVPFHIAARGQGHSTQGQAMARDGVVVDMATLRKQRNGVSITVSKDPLIGHYADVGGEQLWIDVLHASLEHGLAPVSWTDYLYLTVGGTLSNAGISGQSFRYGPQISNVHEMDVITGKGEFVTCSTQKNLELFNAVLGGLGQFGVIARARIALEAAPKRVKWVRLLYSDFSAFTEDQERLISINGKKQKNALDFLEGMLLMNQGPINNWRSSFFPLSDHPRIASLITEHSILYCLEVAKYYDDQTEKNLDKEIQVLLQGLAYIPGFYYEKNVSYVEFLNRVRSGELKLQSQGLWEVPHPWLNLFIPKSQILDFNSGVFRDIILKRNISSGPVLVYPMNRNKWDDRMSASIPDEDVFYTVGFLHSSGFDSWKAYDAQNREILEFCRDAGIKVKQYLPNHSTQEDWTNHFGAKWMKFLERKHQFDPRMILSPGQKIFHKQLQPAF